MPLFIAPLSKEVEPFSITIQLVEKQNNGHCCRAQETLSQPRLLPLDPYLSFLGQSMSSNATRRCHSWVLVPSGVSQDTITARMCSSWASPFLLGSTRNTIVAKAYSSWALPFLPESLFLQGSAMNTVTARTSVRLLYQISFRVREVYSFLNVFPPGHLPSPLMSKGAPFSPRTRVLVAPPLLHHFNYVFGFADFIAFLNVLLPRHLFI
eukprot:Gb_19894 [translate_table: standard]